MKFYQFVEIYKKKSITDVQVKKKTADLKVLPQSDEEKTFFKKKNDYTKKRAEFDILPRWIFYSMSTSTKCNWVSVIQSIPFETKHKSLFHRERDLWHSILLSSITPILSCIFSYQADGSLKIYDLLKFGFYFHFFFLLLKLQALLIVLVAVAIVSAAPKDEGIVENIYGSSDTLHPQEDTEFIFKLKKLKKLLLG